MSHQLTASVGCNRISSPLECIKGQLFNLIDTAPDQSEILGGKKCSRAVNKSLMHAPNSAVSALKMLATPYFLLSGILVTFFFKRTP